jgi:uncharacterized protein YjbI with pentapeptide repeats
LSIHTDEQPLHPKFYEVLNSLPTLDLAEENLRYGNFCNAWLPKTTFPSADKLSGINLCGAQLQGTQLFAWQELESAGSQSRLTGADLSGGEIVGAKFGGLDVGFIAVAAKIEGVELDLLMNADWRNAWVSQPVFLEHTEKFGDKRSRIVNSRFDGAKFYSPQFHGTLISNSTFVGAQISNPLFFSRTQIVSSDFSLANFALPSENYAGENLVTWKNTTFDLMQIPISALSKHSFTAQATSKPKYPLIANAIVAMDSSNKFGPLLVSEPRITSAEIAKLGRMNNNFWLVQAQTRTDKKIQAQQDYSDLLKWCQQGGKVCNGFSPSLQSTATWMFTQMCDKYAIYMSDDIANTLYTAVHARQPSDLHGNYQLYNDAERKKFMRCLKNIHGQPRNSQAGSINSHVFK